MVETDFSNCFNVTVVVDLTEMNSIEMAPVWKQTILNNTFVTCPVKEASHGGQVKTMTMEEHPVDKETFPVLLMGNKFDVVGELSNYLVIYYVLSLFINCIL